MQLQEFKRTTLAETLVALGTLTIIQLQHLMIENKCFGERCSTSNCPLLNLLGKLGFPKTELGALSGAKQSHPHFSCGDEVMRGPAVLTCFAALFDAGEFPELIQPVEPTRKVSLAVARELKFKLNYWNDKLDAQFPELSEK